MDGPRDLVRESERNRRRCTRGGSGPRRRERHRRGSRCRQAPNGCRHIGLGREPGDDLFDLGLSLAAGGVEHPAVVGRSQVRRKEPHRGQIDRTLREHVEDHRKASGGAGDLDAVVGLPLREPEGVPAVDEEGTVATPGTRRACRARRGGPRSGPSGHGRERQGPSAARRDRHRKGGSGKRGYRSACLLVARPVDSPRSRRQMAGAI
jgi:hypothetical protein